MGIHICLYKDGKDHPDWDFLRRGNDRNFPSLIDWEKTTTIYDKYQEPIGFRPTDLDEIKNKLNVLDWEDKGRYLHLISLLEKDESLLLHFSY